MAYIRFFSNRLSCDSHIFRWFNLILTDSFCFLFIASEFSHNSLFAPNEFVNVWCVFMIYLFSYESSVLRFTYFQMIPLSPSFHLIHMIFSPTFTFYTIRIFSRFLFFFTKMIYFFVINSCSRILPWLKSWLHDDVFAPNEFVHVICFPQVIYFHLIFFCTNVFHLHLHYYPPTNIIYLFYTITWFIYLFIFLNIFYIIHSFFFPFDLFSTLDFFKLMIHFQTTPNPRIYFFFFFINSFFSFTLFSYFTNFSQVLLIVIPLGHILVFKWFNCSCDFYKLYLLIFFFNDSFSKHTQLT